MKSNQSQWEGLLFFVSFSYRRALIKETKDHQAMANSMAMGVDELSCPPGTRGPLQLYMIVQGKATKIAVAAMVEARDFPGRRIE